MIKRTREEPLLSLVGVSYLKTWTKAIIFVLIILLVGTYGVMQAKLEEKEIIISIAEGKASSMIYDQALAAALDKVIVEPSQENFNSIVPLWYTVRTSIELLIELNRKEISDHLYSEYLQHFHNQVGAMFLTYSEVEFEHERMEDLLKIKAAFTEFQEFIQYERIQHNRIKNPEQFTLAYIHFCKKVEIDWY